MAKVTDAQLQAMSVADISNKINNTADYWGKLTTAQKKYVAWTLNTQVENTEIPKYNPFNPNETGVSSKWLMSPAGQAKVAELYNGVSSNPDLLQKIQNSSAPTQALFAAMATYNLAKGGTAPEPSHRTTYQATDGSYSLPGEPSSLPPNFTFDTFWDTPTGRRIYEENAAIPQNVRNLANGVIKPRDIKIEIWNSGNLSDLSGQLAQRHKVDQFLQTIYQNPNFQKYYAVHKFDGVVDPTTKTFKVAPTSGALSVYHDNSSGYSAASGASGFQSAIGSQGAIGAQGNQGAQGTQGAQGAQSTTTTTTTPPAGQKKLTDAEQWVLSLTKDEIKGNFPAGYNTSFGYIGFDGKTHPIDLAKHPKIKAYIDSVVNGTASPYEARRVGYLANGSYHAPTLPPGVNFSIDAHLAADQVVYQNGQLVSKPVAPTTTTTAPSTTTTTVAPTTTTTVAPTTTTTGPQGAQGNQGGQGAQGSGYHINLPGNQGGTGGATETPVTIYGNNPKEGSRGKVLQSVFPGLQTGKLSDYVKIIESGALTPQQKLALAQLLGDSGVNINLKNKVGIAQNNELARALGVAFNSYFAAYKGATGKLRPLAGYIDDLKVSGAGIGAPLTLAQQAQLAAQQAAADAREARQQSSIDIISEHLANMGFTGDQLKQLAPFVANQVHSGLSQTAVYANLRQTPQYAQRFPGNAERLKLGKAVLAEGTYTAYEDRIAELSRTYGLPANALTAQTVGHMIANDVAPDEFEKRVVSGYEAMQKADPSTLKMLQQYYGLNPGDIVHYIIDPKNGSAAIERKVSAAKLGASAADAGFQGVTSKQAEDFANFQTTKGVNVAQGIQQAGTMKPLMGTAPGQARQGLTQDQLLQGAIGTSTAAQQTLAGAQEAQAAPLRSGGGAIASQKGVTGAGYAATE